MSKYWTGDMTIKFLKGYESFPCLWDVHSQLYKNRKYCENAYRQLSQLMAIDGFSTIHVKAKIRSIRNAYLLEIGKIRNSRRLTAGEVYKPRVPWFPIAHRILHGVVQIKGAQPSGIKTEPRTESVDSQEDTPLVIADEELPLSENDLRLTPKATSRKLSSTTAPPIRVSKKIREGSAGKALEELQAIARKLEGKSNKEDDEFDCFGKSVSCQLKKLPESVALESMAYIQSYLVQQRLKSNPEKRIN